MRDTHTFEANVMLCCPARPPSPCIVDLSRLRSSRQWRRLVCRAFMLHARSRWGLSVSFRARRSRGAHGTRLSQHAVGEQAAASSRPRRAAGPAPSRNSYDQGSSAATGLCSYVCLLHLPAAAWRARLRPLCCLRRWWACCVPCARCRLVVSERLHTAPRPLQPCASCSFDDAAGVTRLHTPPYRPCVCKLQS